MSTAPRRSLLSLALLSLLAGACSSPPQPTRIDNLPMYGQPEIPRPTQLKQADERFVATAVTEFGGDRRLASIAWSGQAERFLADGNLDYAMRRYNQAWLLDDKNHEVYWGFGRVMLQTDQFDAAITHLKRAAELCTDPAQRPALLSDLGAAYAAKADTLATTPSRRAATFALANEAFTASTTADPKLASAWRQWAISLAAENRWSESAEYARRAAELGAPPLPAATLDTLKAHTRRPKS